MPTRAATRRSMPASGISQFAAAPSVWPQPAPIINRGASVPPDVPLETEIDHEMSFITHRKKTILIGTVFERKAVML